MVVVADTALGAITIQARPARALREGGLGRDTTRAGAIELDDFISGRTHDVPLFQRRRQRIAVDGRH